MFILLRKAFLTVFDYNFVFFGSFNFNLQISLLLSGKGDT